MPVSIGGLPLQGIDANGAVWEDPDINWWSAPAPRMSTGKKPRNHGVWVGDSFLETRTVTIEGRIVALTRTAALAAVDRLHAAIGYQDVTLIMSDAGREQSATVRRSDETIVTWESALIARWSVQCLAADPRKFNAQMSGSTGLPHAEGGLTIGMPDPQSGSRLGLIPFVIRSQIDTGQVSLTNTGTTAGKVTLRIDGPVTNPAITHQGGGKTETFALGLSIGEGEYILADMDTHTVYAQGQSSATRNRWITRRGWHAFEPGLNTWTFSASNDNRQARLTVTALPASI